MGRELRLLTYLNNGLCANHMSSRTHTNSSSLSVLCLLTRRDQLAQVSESAGTVRICKDDIGASCMSHAMCHSTTFASILLQDHHSDGSRGDRRRSRAIAIA